jgi:MFS transporter, MHS family, proline/betaine transporter
MSKILLINMVDLFVLSFFVVVFGYLSDYINKFKMAKMGLLLILFFSYPIFILCEQPSNWAMFIGQGIMSIFLAMLVGTLPNISVGLFPVKIRCTAIALSTNLAATLFGGTAPLIAAYIVKYLDVAPIIYSSCVIFGSLICLNRLQKTLKW